MCAGPGLLGLAIGIVVVSGTRLDVGVLELHDWHRVVMNTEGEARRALDAAWMTALRF